MPLVRWLWMAWAAATLQAASIRGVVLENVTGRPLARTLVRLEAVQGNVAGPVRSSSAGQFSFPGLPAGIYLLSASRPGFAPCKHGQKAWNAPGAPLFLDDNSELFLQLRLQRLGAITGVVADENDVGIADQEVLAYRAARPPKLVARAKSDDTGAYRIGGIEPGAYLVRSAARQLEDGPGLLPTFHREAAAVDAAETVTVSLDEVAREVNLRPRFGNLYRLSGRALAAAQVPAVVTLVSDMGRTSLTADAEGRFRFDQLPPGTYELVAHATVNRRPYGAYERIYIGRNTETALGLARFPSLDLSFEDQEGRAVDDGAVAVYARRKDLAGEGPPQKIAAPRSELLPGPWELAVFPPPEFYTVSVAGRADRGGWSEVQLLGGGMPLRVVLSSRPAALQGRVTRSANEPAAGAPVLLELLDPGSRRIGPLRTTRTDAQGQYRFNGLAPGAYRVLSTFEFDDPDEHTAEAARHAIVTLKEGSRLMQELELYVR